MAFTLSQQGSSPPSNPVVGDVWINTHSGGAFVWTGAKWQGSFVSGEDNKHDVDRARDWRIYVGTIRVSIAVIVMLAIFAFCVWHLTGYFTKH